MADDANLFLFADADHDGHGDGGAAATPRGAAVPSDRPESTKSSGRHSRGKSRDANGAGGAAGAGAGGDSDSDDEGGRPPTTAGAAPRESEHEPDDGTPGGLCGRACRVFTGSRFIRSLRNPTGEKRRRWNFFMMLVVVNQAITIPLRFAFHTFWDGQPDHAVSNDTDAHASHTHGTHRCPIVACGACVADRLCCRRCSGSCCCCVFGRLFW
jgi:hypothetical protein